MPLDVLRRAIAVAAADPAAALRIIDTELSEARIRRDAYAISTLAPHAGAFSLALGEYDRALKYYEEASALDPEDPTIHVAVATARRLTGDTVGARSALVMARDLAVRRHDADALELADKALSNLGGAGDE